MSAREIRKFNEWARKIRSTLKNLSDETLCATLPRQCKFLRSWGEKLQQREGDHYLKIRKTETDLLGKSAHKLQLCCTKYLNEAKKHGVGTKARMVEILRYVYYYGKDVHPNFIRAEMKEQTSKHLNSFWKSYLEELYEFIDRSLLDDYQIQCVRVLVRQSREVDLGLEPIEKLVTKLESRIREPQMLYRILRNLYKDELLVVTDALSEKRRKWSYDKRSKKAIAEAVTRNCSAEDVVDWFRRFCGRELPQEMQREDLKIFPSAMQVGKFVLGPLGIIEGTVKRRRSRSETTRIVLERFLGKDQYLHHMWEDLEKDLAPNLPEGLLPEPATKQEFVQSILAYANDKKICEVTNELLTQGKIQIRISGLYDDSDEIYPWIVTKHGLFVPYEWKEPVESLADLLKQEFGEEDLAPELDMYHGDFESRVLEYCIKENPERILTKMFGFMWLKKVARNLGFRRVQSLHNQHEVVTLILLRLGFSVPPTLTGLRHYTSRLQNCKAKIVGIVDPTIKAGLMSQAYVDMEGFFKNLLFFYVGFLWSDEIKETRWSMKYEDAVKRLLKSKLEIQNPERITFGETIHAIRKLNVILKDNRKLKSKMQKSFDRDWALKKTHLSKLDKISGQRARFVHFGMGPRAFPGERESIELIDSGLNLMNELGKEKIFPSVIRIVAEIADEYGKNYSRAIDEEGNEWTIYSKEWLNATVPYSMHSKTSPIAVNPILVQKIE